MTYGIPNTSFDGTKSPSLDNATWFNHKAFVYHPEDMGVGELVGCDEVKSGPVLLIPNQRTAKNQPTVLRMRAQAVAEAAQGSLSKIKRINRREKASLYRIWKKHMGRALRVDHGKLPFWRNRADA